MNTNAMKIGNRRHFGRIMAALKKARRTRDELANRALSAGEEGPRR
jgi:hypothetical protein